jgi:hypothetical protein
VPEHDRTELLTTVLEVVGIALIVVGISLWSIPVALIVAGIGALAASYAIKPWRGGQR